MAVHYTIHTFAALVGAGAALDQPREGRNLREGPADRRTDLLRAMR
jgi:hypothetical protein